MNGLALLVIGVLCVLLVVFGALRNAVRDFSLRKLEALAKNNGGMAKLEPIVEHDDAHALSLGAVRSLLVAGLLVAWVVALAQPVEGVWTIGAWRLVIAGACGAACVLVFGMALASALSDHAGERLLHALSWLVRAVHALALPLRPLNAIDEVVKRLVGASDFTEKDEIEDDLIAAAMEGERGGTLGESEREMIENVVELRDSTTEEIMTPRTDIEGLELTDDLDTIIAFIKEAGHSRIPVYSDDLDHIEGVLYAKDLLPLVGRGADGFALKPALREALFVHERKPVQELLVELRAKKVHLAIVLDEYGGTTGLVTLEDIMEEIVGEIQDEYETEDDAPPEICVVEDEACAEMDARATVDDVNDVMEALGVELPESDDYETVGGYALAVFGHFPEVGERVISEDGAHALEVLEAEPTRIHRVRVEAIAEEDEASEAEPGEGVEAAGP